MPTRSKATAALTLAVSLVFISASTLTPAAAAGTKRANPCRLVKQADIERIFDSDDVGRIKDPSGLSCVWEVDGGLTGDGPHVSVTYETGPDAEESYRRFSGSGTPVAGLGDEAYYSDVLGLHVLSDGEYIAVEATYGLLGDDGPTEKQRKKKIITVAKQALARQ